MRFPFRILTLLAVALLSPSVPWGGARLVGVAAAQEAPQGSPQDVPKPAALAQETREAQACKRPVTVNDETRTWDPLEVGADDAWRAYVAGDYVKAMPVFLRLARIGHPVAEVLVGYAHFYGLGVPLDYRQALLWLEKAANQGCFTAYELTAQIYDQGLGTSVDFGKAYMWFNIAAAKLPNSAKRDDIMKLRDAVAAKMTEYQVEAAQKRSMMFEPKLVVPPDIQDLPEDWGQTN